VQVAAGVDTMSAMPRLTEAELAALRMKYRAAHAAHQSCLRALSEAALSGSIVSRALREQEARALRELANIRAELLAGLAEAEPGAPIGASPPGTADSAPAGTGDSAPG